MDKERVIDSIDKLIRDIDKCIDAIISARLKKDEHAEWRALFCMESLMVSSMQELSFLRDYIEDKVERVL